MVKACGWLAVTGLTLSVPAMAQRPPLQEQTLPLSQAQPSIVAPSQETQPSLIVPPLVSSSSDGRNKWLPAKAVRLQVLDKVNGLATTLTVQVGEATAFGSLTIMARSCMVRAPDQPVDSAGYLDVTDSHSDFMRFAGWLLANEPSASMMQHPIYDIRVTGCA